MLLICTMMRTMKVPWSSMTIWMAAAAASSACIAAAAAPVEAGASIVTYSIDAIVVPALPLKAAIGNADDVLQPLRAWFDDSYDHAPALMLGLSVLLLVPVLALAGVVVRRSRPRRSPEATLLIRGRRGQVGAEAGSDHSQQTRTVHRVLPAEAWVETENGERVVIGRGMVRIGREADNDLRFTDKTVHRYHAIIRRTTDGEVMITDMSGDDGNGVLVNGARIGEARLARGDVINIGKIKLRFDAQLA